MSLFFNSRNIGEPSHLPRKPNLKRRAKECQVYRLSWIALTANTLKGGQYTMLLLDPVAVIILESNWASCLTFVPGVGIATHSLAQLHSVLDKSCWWPRLLSLGLEWDLGSEQPPFFLFILEESSLWWYHLYFKAVWYIGVFCFVFWWRMKNHKLFWTSSL